MNDLLKKIYENVVLYEQETIEMNRIIENEVRSIMEPYVAKMDDKEKEPFEDMCYDISYVAEYGGFRLGVKYAVKILMEMFEK